ncbi:MAG: hypothetical protein M0Z82_17100 [Actinomycetota bacterium]|jgi:hypothetical protein|nr:hypothetical protein [Actinomycetota bacterium]
MTAAPRTDDERRQVVFVQDFAVLDLPYDVVVARFSADPADCLRGALQAARLESNRLQAKVGPTRWPALLARTVDIALAPPRSYEDGLLVPFTWQAHSRPTLLPTLDADLELAPIGSLQTELVLRGRYHPPAGAIGKHLDQALLHRIADATVRAFVSDVAANLATRDGPATP